MNLTASASAPNTELQSQVRADQKQLAGDTQFVKDHKLDPAALAGQIASIQKDWENFQAHSSTLQNTGNADDIHAAHEAEKDAFDSFDDIHSDLKDAVAAAQAGGDPNAGALASGFASITDQGNVNALHLQAINNNAAALNRDGAGIDGQYSSRRENHVDGFNTEYGQDHGGGIATGGTRSVEDVAAEATKIRTDAGFKADDSSAIGVTVNNA